MDVVKTHRLNINLHLPDLRDELAEIAVQVPGVFEGVVLLLLLSPAPRPSRHREDVVGRNVPPGDELAHVSVVREDVVTDELVEEEDLKMAEMA